MSDAGLLRCCLLSSGVVLQRDECRGAAEQGGGCCRAACCSHCASITWCQAAAGGRHGSMRPPDRGWHETVRQDHCHCSMACAPPTQAHHVLPTQAHHRFICSLRACRRGLSGQRPPGRVQPLHTGPRDVPRVHEDFRRAAASAGRRRLQDQERGALLGI